jgi:hypothetical protein
MSCLAGICRQFSPSLVHLLRPRDISTHASLNAACAAANLAIGTRYGEHET